MEESKMKKHVIVVGAIHIGFGFIGLILALWDTPATLLQFTLACPTAILADRTFGVQAVSP